MAKLITKKSTKRPALVICEFKDNIKLKINSNQPLLLKISNILKTDVEGIQSMLKRDSQTLFHVSVIEAISEALGIEQSELKNCKR